MAIRAEARELHQVPFDAVTGLCRRVTFGSNHPDACGFVHLSAEAADQEVVAIIPTIQPTDQVLSRRGELMRQPTPLQRIQAPVDADPVDLLSVLPERLLDSIRGKRAHCSFERPEHDAAVAGGTETIFAQSAATGRGGIMGRH